MLPGFGQDFLGKEGEEESTRMMKRNMVIMKSMSDAGTYMLREENKKENLAAVVGRRRGTGLQEKVTGNGTRILLT